jgi:retron-type reverse transcriptase
MASGSYHPPPVRRVEIPKTSGGIRTWGIPTADDMICHFRSEKQAQRLLDILQDRIPSCGLQLHPHKSQVVYISFIRLWPG